MTGGAEVQMLWESTEPATALTTRFGFTDVDHAGSWLTGTVRDDWAARVVRCERLVISAGNLLAWLTVDGRRVIAKCCVDASRFARLAEIDALQAWLHSQGIAVAAPIVAQDGRSRVEHERISLGLYPLMAGDLLDVDDPAQVEAAGQTLARLHGALAVYSAPVGAGRAAPGQQLVHGDFRSANVLYDGVGVTAVLDFDEVAYRNRVADLAQAAVLLGTRYHDWAPTSAQTRRTFVAAYGEVSPLTDADRDDLHRGVSAVLKHFGWI